MPVNPKKVLKNRVGLPTKEQILSEDTTTDNMKASIVDPNTGEEAPASLTQGEYVIDIPSIIGLGNGDYYTGLDKLKRAHKTLRQKGLSFLKNNEESNE